MNRRNLLKLIPVGLLPFFSKFVNRANATAANATPKRKWGKSRAIPRPWGYEPMAVMIDSDCIAHIQRGFGKRTAEHVIVGTVKADSREVFERVASEQARLSRESMEACGGLGASVPEQRMCQTWIADRGWGKFTYSIVFAPREGGRYRWPSTPRVTSGGECHCSAKADGWVRVTVPGKEVKS